MSDLVRKNSLVISPVSVPGVRVQRAAQFVACGFGSVGQRLEMTAAGPTPDAAREALLMNVRVTVQERIDLVRRLRFEVVELESFLAGHRLVVEPRTEGSVEPRSC